MNKMILIIASMMVVSAQALAFVVDDKAFTGVLNSASGIPTIGWDNTYVEIHFSTDLQHGFLAPIEGVWDGEGGMFNSWRSADVGRFKIIAPKWAFRDLRNNTIVDSAGCVIGNVSQGMHIHGSTTVYTFNEAAYILDMQKRTMTIACPDYR